MPCCALPCAVPCYALLGGAAFAAQGKIDKTENMANDRVWLLSAKQDSVVAKGVVEKLATYYTSYLAKPATQLVTEYDQAGQHSFLTLDYGSSCTKLASPYINKCDYGERLLALGPSGQPATTALPCLLSTAAHCRPALPADWLPCVFADAAGVLLQHLYGGSLVEPDGSDPDGTKSGSVMTFSQADFLATGTTLTGSMLGREGYLYVPDTCKDDPSGTREGGGGGGGRLARNSTTTALQR